MKKSIILMCCLSLLTDAFAVADTLPQNLPNSDFIDNKNGTVTHKKTRLTWQRCMVGQTWTGSNCSLEASKFTHTGAMQLTSKFAGKTDWRLPTMMELHTIIEYANYNPATNTKVFPNTIGDKFWSATNYSNSNNYFNSGSFDLAWFVDFKTGYSNNAYKTDYYFVRLVRGKWGKN